MTYTQRERPLLVGRRWAEQNSGLIGLEVSMGPLALCNFVKGYRAQLVEQNMQSGVQSGGSPMLDRTTDATTMLSIYFL